VCLVRFDQNRPRRRMRQSALRWSRSRNSSRARPASTCTTSKSVDTTATQDHHKMCGRHNAAQRAQSAPAPAHGHAPTSTPAAAHTQQLLLRGKLEDLFTGVVVGIPRSIPPPLSRRSTCTTGLRTCTGPQYVLVVPVVSSSYRYMYMYMSYGTSYT